MQKHFQINFFQDNFTNMISIVLNMIQIVLKFVAKDLIDKEVSIGSHNGKVQNKCQFITWSNDETVQCCMHA